MPTRVSLSAHAEHDLGTGYREVVAVRLSARYVCEPAGRVRDDHSPIVSHVNPLDR